MEKESGFKSYALFAIDVLTVFFSYALIILISNPISELLERIINIRKIIYVPVVTVVIIFILLDMNRNVYKRYKEVLFNSLLASLLGFMAFAIIIHFRYWHLSHINVSFIYIMLVVTGSLLTERLIIEFFIRKSYQVERLLIIAKECHAYKIAYDLFENKHTSFVVNTIYLTDNGINKIENYLINSDKVILGADINSKDRSTIINSCQKAHKKVFIIPDIYDISIMRPRLTQIDDTPYLYLDSIGLSKTEQDMKRIMDIIFSVLLIIILLPAMLFCAVLVKCTSKGPVFFIQERVTINNKVFNMIKFRTMIINAEMNTGAVLSHFNDSRVTKAGLFLRNTRADEIPQLFNVLKGEMSLIGPRPERPVFVEQYEKSISLYNKRHTVKSGISGLAQIMGKYSTTAEDKLRYDLIYIRNYSILMDIKILFLTLRTAILEIGSSKEAVKADYKNEVENRGILIVKEKGNS